MSNKIKAIKNIEDKYGAVLFGMALTHLVDIGVRHLTDFNFNEAVRQINERNEQYSLISAEFQIEIVRCATELAKFDIWDLFYYIKCLIDENYIEELAFVYGIDTEDILTLIEFGYDVFDIEEMLCCPEIAQEYLDYIRMM